MASIHFKPWKTELASWTLEYVCAPATLHPERGTISDHTCRQSERSLRIGFGKMAFQNVDSFCYLSICTSILRAAAPLPYQVSYHNPSPPGAFPTMFCSSSHPKVSSVYITLTFRSCCHVISHIFMSLVSSCPTASRTRHRAQGEPVLHRPLYWYPRHLWIR